MSRHAQGPSRLAGRFWPAYVVTVEPDVPRLADGTVDIRALCRMWDDDYNRQFPPARMLAVRS